MAEQKKERKEIDPRAIRTFVEDVEEAKRGAGRESDETLVSTPRPKLQSPQKKNDSNSNKKSEEQTLKESSVEPNSILTGADDVFDVSHAFHSDVEMGTIVTDKRSPKKSFLRIIKSAFDEWFGGVEKSVKKQTKKLEKPPEPKVVKPEARKETIRKAGKRAVHIPAEDHTTIIKKLRSHGSSVGIPSDKSYQLKPKQESVPVTWTHLTEDKVKKEASAKTEQSHTQEAKSEVLKEKIPAVPEKKIEEETPSTRWSFFTGVKKKEVKKDAPEKNVQTPKKEVSSSQFSKENVPVLEKKIEKRYVSKKKEKPSRLKNIVIGGVIVLTLAAGIGAGIFFAMQTRQEASEEEATIVSFMYVNEVIKMPLQRDRNSFMATLKEMVDSHTNGVVHISPMRDEMKQASTEEILGVIDPNVPDTFIRSLESEMMIGGVTVGENAYPYFILRSKNFDTAFAGMLSWEPFILSDLAPLFMRSNNTFIDRSFDNRAARLTQNEAGEEYIAYTFFDRETIIITTNIDAIRALIAAF